MLVPTFSLGLFTGGLGGPGNGSAGFALETLSPELPQECSKKANAARMQLTDKYFTRNRTFFNLNLTNYLITASQKDYKPFPPHPLIITQIQIEHNLGKKLFKK